ncbi:MAG: class I SAM-dependent methyltransferase [Anaerolineae bacterium]|nr:class I SAM-dependent methyltransferase [Anaerolineae bacterium]
MFYDTFSSDYDRFVSWPGRLALEIPFLTDQLRAIGAKSVLDAACGTGMHTLALSQAGFDAAGADLSAGMIARAMENAQAVGLQTPFKTAGFGELSAAFGPESFDALFCLGNSLPHLLTPELLSAALADFALVLKPGGLVIIQNRNFDAVMAKRQRWMEPQSARDGQIEWLFQRFYDFESDGLLTFNVITLRREETGNWVQSVQSTQLRPLLSAELQSAFQEAGFESISCYGDLTGSVLNPESSGNLVIVARR